ncbi:MAG: cysteine hydrolase [Deltaproteobacteria bacterium]|nr:MAG: cysteine hydrolase [Deltaproteobacteria bacterium]TMB38964.1 MAG: cysteine hydrolase [Deltaproteobacteria bacterium]
MMRIDPKTTAVVSIDMHRGHLDPSVATLPLPAESCRRVIRAARELFEALRSRGVPVVHVVTSYRDPAESLSNPFWKAIAEDPAMKRSAASRHNMAGSPGTQVIPELLDSRDVIVDRKKRYDCFQGTDLDFVLQRKLGARTLVLTGVNTNSCVLCTAFEANARDYGVVVAADCVDTMDGPEMHEYALRNMAITVAWVLPNDELLRSLAPREEVGGKRGEQQRDP